MNDPLSCPHESFHANVKVARLSHDEGGPINGFCAEVEVKCTQCGVPFRFVGLNAGSHHSEPRVSPDGIELRAPIEPATHERWAPRASYVFPRKKGQH